MALVCDFGWLRFGLWGCFMARLVSSVFLFGVLLLSGICGRFMVVFTVTCGFVWG